MHNNPPTSTDGSGLSVTLEWELLKGRAPVLSLFVISSMTIPILKTVPYTEGLIVAY